MNKTIQLMNLRHAQRMVCDVDYADEYRADTDDYWDYVDDMVWDTAYDLNEQGLVMPVDEAEQQFVSSPTVDTARQYWYAVAVA